MSLRDRVMALPDRDRESLIDKLTSFFDCELEDRFREALDDIHGVVKIAGYEYSTSAALEAIDPTAFRCDCADFLDADTTIVELDGDYYDAAEVEDALDRYDSNQPDED